MLFEQVLESDIVKNVFGECFGDFRKMMMAAERFDLSPQFACAVDTILSENPDSYSRAEQLIKPPYDVTWWEVAADFRPALRDAERKHVQANNGNMTARVGVLIYAPASTERLFLAHVFYSSAADRAHMVYPSMGSLVADFSEDGVVRNAIARRVKPCGYEGYRLSLIDNPYLRPELRATLSGAQMVRSIEQDWGGEAQFWSTCLMLLNSRNVAYSEALPETRRHKKLRLAGLSPLSTFRICKLDVGRLTKRQSIADVGNSGSARAHFVRGHFKVRASGVYWWRPFVRGDVGKGFAKKHYELVGTQS